MLKKWVDSLFLGTWHLQNGDVFECAPGDRDYYLARVKETLADGVPLPVCLEHQPDVGLSFHDRMAEQTRNTIGHCHDARVGSLGQIQLLVDAQDEANLKILAANKYASPEIRQNVINSATGKRYPGPSIVHLASTPRPVQVTGSPHIRLSTANAVSLSAVAVDVSLSAATFQPRGKAVGTKLSYDPDGEHYMKAQSGAMQASEKAHQSSAAAHQAFSGGDHKAASAAHAQASEHHATAAKTHMAAGNKKEAAHHQVAANAHKSLAASHGSLSGAKPSTSMSTAKPDKELSTDTKEPTPPTDDLPPLDDASAIDVPPVNEEEAKVAAAIAELTHVFEPMGIMFHASASDTALAMLQHVITAVKTHQATKEGHEAEQDEEDEDLANKPNQDPNQQQPPGAEVAESPPIMMSTATLTPREQKMHDKLIGQSKQGIVARIAALHGKGFIDDKIKSELEAELGTIKLSLTEDGDLRPNSVAIKVEAYERLAKSGKAGSFAPTKSVAPAVPNGKPNPKKPISSAVALSTANEQAVDPPDNEQPTGEGKINPKIMDRLTGGRWSEQQLAKKNGQAH